MILKLPNSTIRYVYDDNNTIMGTMGRVDELMHMGIFRSCSESTTFWVFLYDKNYGGKAIFAESREELLKRLMNHKL